MTMMMDCFQRSYCEAEGISGYMPEADGGLLADAPNVKEEGNMDTIVRPLLQQSLLI